MQYFCSIWYGNNLYKWATRPKYEALLLRKYVMTETMRYSKVLKALFEFKNLCRARCMYVCICKWRERGPSSRAMNINADFRINCRYDFRTVWTITVLLIRGKLNVNSPHIKLPRRRLCYAKFSLSTHKIYIPWVSLNNTAPLSKYGYTESCDWFLYILVRGK